MSTLFLDLANGISGDMAVAALLSLSGQVEQTVSMLEKKLRSLPLTDFTIEAKEERRSGISGVLFTVHHEGGDEHPRDLRSIRELINRSMLADSEKELSLSVFDIIAGSEAAIHGTSPERVHFHEVGAVDSIVDIVSFSVLYNLLGPDRVIATSVALGSGTTNSMHGEIPIPAPATLDILRGVPVRGTDRGHELTTPTGAALVRHVVSQFGPLPLCRIRGTGLGFGHRTSSFNGLRVLDIEEGLKEEDCEAGSVALIEAAIDDSTPEEIGFLQELLLSGGALDVWVAPIFMKKNRPGSSVTVVCPPSSLEELSTIILRKSSSFGLRYSFHERRCLRRRQETVQTRYGPLRVKVGMLGDEVVKVVPEYEDCRASALRENVPLSRVFDAAKRAAGMHVEDGT
jgi:uncharacterized protein (TIGR00299 family) protein